jgi:hypothetical protein
MDPAGYFHTLDEFAGSVLVLGVFDPGLTGADAFAGAYARYGSTADVRFLGVAPGPEALPEDGPFPRMFNRGSTLLETPAGEFAIVTPEGAVHARGPLGDALDEAIAASLQQFAAR